MAAGVGDSAVAVAENETTSPQMPSACKVPSRTRI